MSVYVANTETVGEHHADDVTLRVGIMRSALVSDDLTSVSKALASNVELRVVIPDEDDHGITVDRDGVDFLLRQLTKVRDLLDAPEVV